MKKHMLAILTIVVIFLSPVNLFIFNADASNNWIIDGDTVYINDENVYLSVYPHTLVNDGNVVFELETKNYDGDIDIVWGFDIPNCTPYNPQIWINYTHEFIGYHYVDRIGSIDIYNVTAWDNLGIENFNNYTVDYGKENNSYLMNISYETNKTLIIAFSSYIELENGNDYRLTGHYDSYESYIYYESFFDWLKWNADFEIINYEYGEMNTWFLLKDVPIVHNHRYKVKAFIDIPFNTIGKYWFALKPSDKTIQQAINDNTFHCLDPWWDSDFSYYKTITIDSDNIDSDLTNFPILVVIDDTTADKCNVGDSIRFLDTDNTTEYYYEIEKWVDNEDRIVWVNITSISSTVDTKFLMYYGNADAPDNQNPSDVWDSNYLAVWHFKYLTDSTSNNIYLTNVGADEGQAGKIGDCYGFVAASKDYMMHSSFLDVMPDSDELTFEVWVYHDSDPGADQVYLGKNSITSEDRFLFRRTTSTDFLEMFAECGNGGNKFCTDDVATTDTAWHYQVGTMKATVAIAIFRDTYKTNGDVIGVFRDGTTNNFEIGRWHTDISYMDGKLEELRVSSVVRSDAWIKACFNNQNQTTDFLTFGSEQQEQPPLPNNTPLLTNEYPTNNTIDIRLFPVLGVTISDIDNDNMTIIWYSNVSGTWEIIGNNLSDVYNGTYYQKFTEFAIYGLTYYWNASVNDGTDINLSETFSFTAETIPSESNDNGEIGLLGIFGFMGFLLFRKHRKNSGNKKKN